MLIIFFYVCTADFVFKTLRKKVILSYVFNLIVFFPVLTLAGTIIEIMLARYSRLGPAISSLITLGNNA